MKFTAFSTFFLLVIPIASAQVILKGQKLFGSKTVTAESVSPSITPNGGSGCQVVINGAGITEGTTIVCSDGTIAVDLTSSAAAMTQTTALPRSSSAVLSTSVVFSTSAVSGINTLSGTSVASRTISGTGSIAGLPLSSSANPVISSTFTGGVAGATSGLKVGFAGVAGFLGVMAAL